MSINALGIEIRESERARRLAREAEAFDARRRADRLGGAYATLDEAEAELQQLAREVDVMRVAAICGWVAAVVATGAMLANMA